MSTEEPQWTAWKAYLDEKFGTTMRQVIADVGGDPSERSLRRLFWRDNCERYRVNKWTTYAGSTVSYNDEDIPAFEGDGVLKLVDDGSGVFAYCFINFGQFSEARHSVELWWYREIGIMEMWIDFALNDGAENRNAYIRWNAATDRWEYTDELDADGNAIWKPVSGGAEYIDYDTWNRAKLTVDWSTNKIVALETTGLDLATSIDMLIRTTSAHNTRVRLNKNSQNPSQPIYFDDIRVYQNELT